MEPRQPLVIVVTQAGIHTPKPTGTPTTEIDPRASILAALVGRYCKLKDLVPIAKRSHRQTSRIVRVLLDEGRVRYAKRKGYYRPDAPPG